ncbi:MAG: RluA family pseudouridine synthase, partial [Epsilonproteobacteria bacterium]|nr:RluA family pseudouridine synthase [Campylobacterota bacterium]
IEKLIKSSLVKVNGNLIQKPSFKIKEGDRVDYKFIEAKKSKIEQIDIDIEKLYEDEDILILNKPSNLVVHSAPSVKEATLVDWLKKEGISLSTINGEERFGIVHRLDKDTTGAIVIAKNNYVHKELAAQLQNRSMGRYYLAIINYPLKDNIEIVKPIGRNPKNRLKMAVVDYGKEAKSRFVKILEGKNQEELIGAKLYSGRTHQIRVHLSSLNRYILGDELYAPKSVNFNHRIFLHAYLIYLIHPRTKKPLEVVAPLFEDMREYIVNNFNKGEEYVEIDKEWLKSSFNGNSF